MWRRIGVGQGARSREIAVLEQEGEGPPIVWLGGFRSDMRATKAEALAQWARGTGRAFIRFDYSGHGESGGDFEDGSISVWLEDSLAAIGRAAGARPVLVGSSMGAWIALLLARRLSARNAPAPTGMALIAPAVDFTEILIRERLSPGQWRKMREEGFLERPSRYDSRPYRYTLQLVEDGRNHLLLNGPVAPGCPVHILHGAEDADIPLSHGLRLFEALPREGASITIVKDADHRLSRPQDIELLIRIVESLG